VITLIARSSDEISMKPDRHRVRSRTSFLAPGGPLLPGRSAAVPMHGGDDEQPFRQIHKSGE
jgi:hypothetical protein